SRDFSATVDAGGRTALAPPHPVVARADDRGRSPVPAFSPISRRRCPVTVGALRCRAATRRRGPRSWSGRWTAWRMKHHALIATLVWTAALFAPPATGEEVNSTLLQCDIGPIAKTFGRTQWLVYSCNDNRTVIIVAAPGNPATPFYFAFYPQAEGYRLVGEGTGRKDAPKAAFDELQALSQPEIA